MLIAPYPLAMAVVGAVVLFLVPATKTTAVEIGKALVWAGLFAFAFAMAAHTVQFP